jgi:hypothetical protein
MKRRNPDVHSAASAGSQQFADPVPHNASGFVGEGNSKDRLGRNTLLDEMRHAIGDHASLTSAGPGKHEDWPFRGKHGFALALVQPGEEWRCVWKIAQVRILADENQLSNFDRTGSLSSPFIFTAA